MQHTHPPRAYSAKGRTPEHRAREAQRAACRSAAGRHSRPPRAAASAESEGPSSPLTRRERACVGVGRCLTAPACAPYSFWWGGRRQASLPMCAMLLNSGGGSLATFPPPNFTSSYLWKKDRFVDDL